MGAGRTTGTPNTLVDRFQLADAGGSRAAHEAMLERRSKARGRRR